MLKSLGGQMYLGQLSTYRIVASTNTCYYSENQVLGGVTTRDMSLFETCHYSKIQKFKNSKILKSRLVTWVLNLTSSNRIFSW